MKWIAYTLIIFISLTTQQAMANAYSKYLGSKWKLSKTQLEYIKKHKVIADATVTTNDKNIQTFTIKASGMHQKKCYKVLRKVSMLENYKNWINFINYSTYNDKSRLFTLKADHVLLPFPMVIHIIVDRPTKPGKYPFTFPTGMFKGLKGYFEIKEFNNKCLFFAESYWSGPKTGLSDFVIELFSETLAQIGGEMIIRKT